MVTYEGNFDGMEMSLTYYAKGDKVYKQTAENVIPYSAIGVTTKEEAQAILDPVSQEYQGIAGLTESLEYGDDAVVETLSIDFETVDIDAVKDLEGMFFDEDSKNGISLKKSGEALEASGFTKVESSTK